MYAVFELLRDNEREREREREREGRTNLPLALQTTWINPLDLGCHSNLYSGVGSALSRFCAQYRSGISGTIT